MDQRSKIAILGFGVEGKAILVYLKTHGYSEITVCDVDSELARSMPEGVSTRLGPDYMDNLADFDVIFRSPGIRVLDPKVQVAVNNGVELTSSTAFFLDQAKCPVIGVTGTKGKGTTCTLIYEMLKAARKDAYLAGNIGDPAISLLDKISAESLVVLELSSFQLQDLTKSPRYAVLLNTTKDHLDYHADRDEYLQAKESLLSHQTDDNVAVLNHDYEYSKYYKPLVKGRLFWVSVKGEVKNGAFVEDGVIYFVAGGGGHNGDSAAERDEICNVKDVALIGSHNLENVLPAVTIAKVLGVNSGTARKVIENFAGLPHRLEFVEEKNGVKYYNDSFATTPETSMAAVDSFEEPTVLIAGGYYKGLDFDEWAVKILTKASLKTVVLMGNTAEAMEKELKAAEEKLGEAIGSPTAVLKAHDMKDAVKKAASVAEKGGVVVMSPAAQSFDLFRNYKERGEAFRQAVKAL